MSFSVSGGRPDWGDMHGIDECFKGYITGSPLIAFAAAFAGGVLTSLTPCVYPMIPVTVAYIGGRSAGGGKGRGFLLSIAYVLGVALMYSLLGAVAALTGKMFGTWVSNPAVYFVMGNLFILLGLSMLDVFNLPIPRFLMNISPKKRSTGVVGAFFVGTASAFVAAPCTAPVLLSILTYVATKQNLLYGIALLFTFALGLGLIMVVVGTFAGTVASLPKSGEWMVKVKKAFGWLLIAAAEYFLIEAGMRWM